MSDNKHEQVTYCPICHPLSYYGGKTGLPEKSGSVCELCVAEITPYALRFDAVNHTDYYPVTTELVQCKKHADGFNLLLDESLFSVVKEGLNFVFFKNPAVRADKVWAEEGEKDVRS